MKKDQRQLHQKWLTAGIFTILVGVGTLLFQAVSDAGLTTDTSVSETQVAPQAEEISIASSDFGNLPVVPEAQETKGSAWIDNNGEFTGDSKALVEWLEAGNPVQVQFGEGPAAEYGFRPMVLTSDDFQISSGVDSAHASEYRVYSGREFIGSTGLGEKATLAVVNGAVSMAITRDGIDYLLETDPETGALTALQLQSFHSSDSCDSGHASCETTCQSSISGEPTAMVAPTGFDESALERFPVTFLLSGKAKNSDERVADVVASNLSADIEDHQNLRFGQQYNDSMRDVLILWTSSKSQTGPASGLSSKAASYLSIAARTAEAYERQLGLRYLLQELILIPSDSSEEDPGNPPTGSYSYPDLDHYRVWLNTHRPQATYKYGHAALWTIVEGGSGGVVGRAWMDAYGSSSNGHSVQEPNWGWSVHTHEFGHNVGAYHTSGGIMNPSLQANEDFYKFVESQTFTGAMDVYNYMGSPTRAYVYGDALMRHPEEIPFGKDDSVTIPINDVQVIDTLANDLTSVTNGAVNAIRLVEVGQVYPRGAGTATIVDGLVEFDPTDGFTGQAWFAYTLGGNVGNSGKGWLHSADVLVTIGGNASAVTQNPSISLQDDFVSSDFSSEVRINPLLNDEGDGYLWSGDVHVVLGPNDTSEESYSIGAFRLVGATLLSGTGTLTLETRDMTRAGTPSQDYTGLIIYSPGGGDSDQVVIEYTAMDVNGVSATAQITLAPSPSVSVIEDLPQVTEDSGDILSFTFERLGGVDLSVNEYVSFCVGGTASPSGLRSDYALAGQESFDPSTCLGSILIPAGQREVTLFVAVLDDGVTEPIESLTVTITGSSSLTPSSSSASSTVFISDSSILYEESFDSFTSDSVTWAGWENMKNKNPNNGKGGDDWFDWIIDSGTTPTSGTGPSVDHTSGSGKYLLAEATGNTNDFTLLNSPSIDLAGQSGAELNFWYHMYGSGTGSLSVDLYINGSLAVPGIWSRSGQQSSNGSDWKLASINLDSYLPAASMQLRMRVDIGSSQLGDIAIDDVSIVSTGAIVPQQPSILFEPVSQVAEEGTGVYLSVIPTGFPAPQVQWAKNGVAIPGATGGAFFIPSMDLSQIGDYSAGVSNTEGSLESIVAAVSLPGELPVLPYLEWATLQGLIGPQGDMTADPDFDGIANLFEFAFGMTALASGETGSLPAMGFHQELGETFLQITYRRLIGGSGTTGVDYTVEGITYSVETNTCLDAETWVSGIAEVQVVGVPVSNNDGTESVTVRRTAPMSSGCAFIRVSVVSN